MHLDFICIQGRLWVGDFLSLSWLQLVMMYFDTAGLHYLKYFQGCVSMCILLEKIINDVTVKFKLEYFLFFFPQRDSFINQH